MKSVRVLLALSMLFLVVIVRVSISNVNASTTVTLNPVADTYTDSSNPAANYGGQDLLSVENNRGGIERAYLRFDLSSIPSGSTVFSAHLQLYSSVVYSTVVVNAYYCYNTTWDELGITFMDYPSYNATAIDAVVVDLDGKWYNWTVTSATQQGLDTSGALSLVMEPPTKGEDYVTTDFYSKDQQYSWTADYIPKLVITYSTAIPEFPNIPLTIGLLSVAGITLVLAKRKLPKQNHN